MKNKFSYINSVKDKNNKSIKAIAFLAQALIFLLVGYFFGRKTVQEELKQARMITTRNMLLINDYQCSEKLKNIIEENNKKGWF